MKNEKEKIDFKKWEDKYMNVPVVDIYKELSKKSIEIIKKLGIEIEKKIYTENEFEVLEMKLSEYYEYEGIAKEEQTYIKSLEGTGVTNKEVGEVLEEINRIQCEHNF